jgi:hypothetical protein
LVVGALGFAPLVSNDDRDCIIYSLDEEFTAAAADVLAAPSSASDAHPWNRCGRLCRSSGDWAN